MKESLRHSSEFKACIEAAPRYPNLLGYPTTGERKWIIRKGQPWPCHLTDGKYLYVVMPDGEIRITENPRPISKMHHPELAKGKEVIAAGIIITEDKKVTFISNESGHYCPDADSVNFALLAFDYWRIPRVQNITVDSSWVCK